MTLLEILLTSLKQRIMDILPYDKKDTTLSKKMASMTASDVILTWLNWNQRIIPAQKRTVFTSREISKNKEFIEHESDIRQVFHDIEAGNKLDKYLSRAVTLGIANPSKNGHSPDLDLMLNAWGVHHLHFSKIVESDGFVKRNKLILFAIFHDKAAYIIDVMTHSDWTSRRVIEIIVHNWPNDGLVHEIQGVLPPHETVSDDKLKAIRKAKGNSAIDVDKKLYFPTGAINSAGHSINTMRTADKMMIDYEEFARRCDENPSYIKELFHNSLPLPYSVRNLSAYIDISSYGIIDKVRNTTIIFGRHT